jgi:CheY-like chemotaxis protein
VVKILVADDNSNIQKMVGLALKDQGIDVVAVGNGEAAVRKISDIHPDLVLADVFMPVRNGYEVCQYVKTDSTLSHIPVILLVGAFDPLDEQEAQRVGADGVLKKPFVPPDPLISMVKSALARAGVSLAAANAAKNAAVVQGVEIPVPAASHASVATIPEVAAMADESFVEEMSPRPPDLKIDSGAHAPAFGSLLETPAVEEEQDIALTATAKPEVERDWRSADVAEEVEEEEEEEAKASWRRDAGDEAFADDGITGPVHDWRDTAFGQNTASQSKEKADFAEAEETQDVVIAATTKAEAVTPARPFPDDAWAAGTSGRPQESVLASLSAEAMSAKASPEPATLEPVSVEKKNEVTAPVVSASEVVQAEPERQSAAGSWFSVSPNPWQAEAQKASHLASSWDTVDVTAPKELEAAVAEGPPSYASEPLVQEEAAIPAATVEAIREEAAQVAESVTQETSAAGGTAKISAAETDMEAMITKVLSKLNPDVLQALTREILKPVIESIVKDELNAKKP